ncbi:MULTISPECIES: hypothetical protein [Pseudomonas]|uniref:hypothetical protein n=2 Tax=Pseudomonas TaxID=286 RepID=UPI0009970930|nr:MULTISPECIES: hypothetical protein [Pseudomonas]MBM2561851.1 hypothetical protein [Pseudomonas sp. AF1]MBM2590232.1 hypothetical protein [Pseudomonas sp. BIS]MBM2605277.1 hypothetical protein [Pseudomonas sp. BIS1]MCT5793997.1 hypothetical protein [Pseudomonas aeruginosa]OSC91932.1 hypothetical protein BZY60_021460 [Pseudomonas aeruginosa]
MRQRRERTQKENELQSAIIGALGAYCRDKRIRCSHLEYFANQQGDGVNRVCADFLATLDDSTLLLAETKVQEGGELIRFEEEQYKENLSFERCGFPIIYVYNTASLMPYYEKPQPYDFPEMTLAATNYSEPSMLPDKYPAMEQHYSLLEWLKQVPVGGDNTTRFARIFAAIRSEGLLTNGLMMLIYGTSSVKLLDQPTANDLDQLIDTLTIGATGRFLNPKQQKQLERFLAEEANALNSWINFSDPQNGTQPLLPPVSSSSPVTDGPGHGARTKRSNSGYDDFKL